MIHSALPEWVNRVRHVALQEPLIETRPTLAALDRLQPRRAPQAVFVGLGICSAQEASAALPVDVLGVLLPAERLRRAAGAKALVVMVADAHASKNGIAGYQIERQTRQILRILERIKQAALSRMQIIRASSFHSFADYLDLLADVQRRAPGSEHPYFLHEVADIEYLHRRFRGVFKVGWCINRGREVTGRQDEVAFDSRFVRWFGRHVGFAYCRAGRTLEPARPRACPYVAAEPTHRVCLDPNEQVALKVASGQAAHTRALRNYLNRIARCYAQIVQPLSGSVEDRIQDVITHIFAGTEPAIAAEKMTA